MRAWGAPFFQASLLAAAAAGCAVTAYFAEGVVATFALLAALTVLCVMLFLFWRSTRKPQWLPHVQHAVELWCSANPEYELNDTRVPAALREALQTLSTFARGQQGRVTAEVHEATARYHQDRVLLRGLIESADDALIAATIDGRILLYNAAASQLVATGSDDDGTDRSALGLGRSIFVVFRRWAMSHFVARLTESGRRVTGVLASRAGRTFHARFSPLNLDGRRGFLLALEPLEQFAPEQSDLARFVEPRRARLANLQAAAETLQDYGDLPVEQMRRLLDVVAVETRQLVQGFEQLSERLQREGSLPLDDVAARDLLPLMAKRLEVPVIENTDLKTAWLKLESASLMRVCESADQWLREDSIALQSIELVNQDGHPVIRLNWQGDGSGAIDNNRANESFERWQSTVVDAEDGAAGWTPQQLLELQRGTLWMQAGSINLLVQSAEQPPESVQTSEDLPARPEYFDFDLFDAPIDKEAQELPLNRLILTVFDTETTGLNPSQGDEIISMGAIRVVNGKLVGQEVFETLVRTDKPIHPESQKIHGIHAGMLRGAPGQSEAIRRFLSFTGESLVVGHNVAFDMRFLDIAAKRYGLELPNNTLDTLLLSSVVYPERDQHRLEDIAKRLGVTVMGRHTSLGDALVTAEVFCRLLPLLEQKGIRTLGQALEASRESWYARVDY